MSYKITLLCNLLIELFLYFYFKNKFKQCKVRINVHILALILAIYPLVFDEFKLLLLTYMSYNYLQFEARLVANTEFKIPFLFKIFNVFGCIYNLFSIYLTFKFLEN